MNPTAFAGTANANAAGGPKGERQGRREPIHLYFAKQRQIPDLTHFVGSSGMTKCFRGCCALSQFQQIMPLTGFADIPRRFVQRLRRVVVLGGFQCQPQRTRKIFSSFRGIAGFTGDEPDCVCRDC
jgi:hypothetical protein